MKKLYCFDFDGTLTKKDTLFLFLRSYNSSRYFWAYLKHLPLFFLLKIKLLEAQPVKRSFVNAVLKGEKKQKLEQAANAFFEEVYPSLIRDAALEFIESIPRESVDSVLVTASLDLWAQPFAKHWNMELLSTEMLYENGVYLGEFKTKNCNGKEKVNRLENFLENRKYDKVIAFGDSLGDQAMFRFASESHFKFFH
ncbi:HAD family hydrolase [Chryseobacterium sp. A301]